VHQNDRVARIVELTSLLGGGRRKRGARKKINQANKLGKRVSGKIVIVLVNPQKNSTDDRGT